jgi:hypothetical protein
LCDAIQELTFHKNYKGNRMRGIDSRFPSQLNKEFIGIITAALQYFLKGLKNSRFLETLDFSGEN